MALKLPQFGKFLSALQDAGVRTNSPRQFWGGVTPEGDIVVTTWTNAGLGGDRFFIWRPNTRHGGLLDMWELGRIEPGATVKLIMLRPKAPDNRKIHSAGLMPGRWRIVELAKANDGHQGAIVEPVPSG